MGSCSGSVAVVTVVPASEPGVAVDVGLDSNVANSWGAESLMNSGDPDRRLDCLGILEEALTGFEDHSSLDFLRRLDRLGVETSSSSMKDTRDFKKLMLASKRDILVCNAGAHQVSPTEGI